MSIIFYLKKPNNTQRTLKSPNLDTIIGIKLDNQANLDPKPKKLYNQLYLEDMSKKCLK